MRQTRPTKTDEMKNLAWEKIHQEALGHFQNKNLIRASPLILTNPPYVSAMKVHMSQCTYDLLKDYDCYNVSERGGTIDVKVCSLYPIPNNSLYLSGLTCFP